MSLNANKTLISLSEAISLKGKKTLISGAASGIGKATCLRFAEAGSDLLLVDIDEKGLKKIEKDLSIFNVEIRVFVADLSGKNKIDDLWGNLSNNIPDILINNSGIYPPKNYLEIDQEFYDRILGVNLDSVVWMSQNFIRARKKSGGIIVNTSSIEAIVPFKDEMVHYSISKSGVYALTRSLAHDYGKEGFRINGIIPGTINTPGINNRIKTALKRMDLGLFRAGFNYKARLPLGRLGKPDEVAKVMLFLCSDLASYVQGVMIPVDGGFLSS
jgi:NAD(P)-dependent dehydrogenase (short-subunit alcohol dehydrogenase family)